LATTLLGGRVELRDDAKDTLDSYLFDDVYNNRNPDEDTWDITFMGDEYLMLHRDTGQLFNFRVNISQGRLNKDQIKQMAEDQEWFNEQ